jgi:hypothetical protein
MASLAEKPYDIEHVSRNVKIRLILLFLKALFCQLTVTLYPDFINFSQWQSRLQTRAGSKD